MYSFVKIFEAYFCLFFTFTFSPPSTPDPAAYFNMPMPFILLSVDGD